ncbi:MAG: UDP-N-acetylmuramoyl-L-alanine--D-glutamate ligase [Ruminococcaceae bacterium]|nr:UDP-N-acetylmuramoyl-L-alanine--D-glutamate ligase [Oscillospiraceae bacterium]
MTKAQAFFENIAGKRVAICGLGTNNPPVIHQFLQAGAQVLACDRRCEEELGAMAEELRSAGAELCLGDGYLDRLDVDMILRTPGMKPYLPQFEEARKKGICVTSEMELFFELCEAPIYAVTGSDGKTTTTTIVAGLLDAGGIKTFVGGNIGRALLPYVHDIRPEDAAVVELSSFQLTGMTQSPQVAVVTNVAPNHLDWHTDMQEYIDAKLNLVSHQKSGDRAVLNLDNAITAQYAQHCSAPVWQFSRQQKVENGCWLNERNEIVYSENGVDTVVMNASDIKIPGVHNIENYMAAIAAVWGKVDPNAIRQFARAFGGVAHRCELVRERGGVRWYNDSIGSSPSRTIAGLKAFDQKVILIAGGYDKHIPYDPLGPVAAEKVKFAVLMGATAPAIETAIRACSDLPIYRVSGMEEAVSTADGLAKDGDIVFMSPASASFDMYKNFEVRGNHFRDLVNGLPE